MCFFMLKIPFCKTKTTLFHRILKCLSILPMTLAITTLIINLGMFLDPSFYGYCNKMQDRRYL